MFTIATPWVLLAAGVAAMAIGALHLLSVRQPPTLLLPTARFVAGGDARAVARRPRPNDVLLLLLRWLALLAAGLALAGARCAPARDAELHLVAADERRMADTARLLQTVRRESAARVLTVPVRGLTDDPGAALVVAQRVAAQAVREDTRIGRVALTVIVPPRVRSIAAWQAWRGRWPGAVNVHMEPDTARVETATVRMTGIAAADDDVVAAAFAGTVSASAAAHVVTIDRGVTSESALPVLPAGEVYVRWPRDGALPGWPARTPVDSAQAIAAGELVLVAPLVRRATAPRDTAARAIAWYGDGAVAATERAHGAGCVRDVAIDVPSGSDLLLSSAAAGLRSAITSPCGGITVASSAIAEPATGQGAPADVSDLLKSPDIVATWGWLQTALLLLALAALTAEWLLRRREARA
jgi:hypothetical protein